MPYIKKDKREQIDDLINQLTKKFDTASLDVGLLNYTISKLLWDLFRDNPRYKAINDLVGVLECIKLEAYRRPFSSYENEKLKENGDI